MNRILVVLPALVACSSGSSRLAPTSLWCEVDLTLPVGTTAWLDELTQVDVYEASGTDCTSAVWWDLEPADSAELQDMDVTLRLPVAGSSEILLGSEFVAADWWQEMDGDPILPEAVGLIGGRGRVIASDTGLLHYEITEGEVCYADHTGDSVDPRQGVCSPQTAPLTVIMSGELSEAVIEPVAGSAQGVTDDAGQPICSI